MWWGEANFPDSLALRDGPVLSPETGHDRPVEAPGRWSELAPSGSDKPDQIKTQSVFFFLARGRGVWWWQNSVRELHPWTHFGPKTRRDSAELGGLVSRVHLSTGLSTAESSLDPLRLEFPLYFSFWLNRHFERSRVTLNSQCFAMFILRRSASRKLQRSITEIHPSKGKPPLHEWKHSQPGGGSTLCDRLLPFQHMWPRSNKASVSERSSSSGL